MAALGQQRRLWARWHQVCFTSVTRLCRCASAVLVRPSRRGSETLLRIRSLAGCIIDTQDSSFRKRQPTAAPGAWLLARASLIPAPAGAAGTIRRTGLLG